MGTTQAEKSMLYSLPIYNKNISIKCLLDTLIKPVKKPVNKSLVKQQELRMISCLEKNFVATQKTIFSQPKGKVLQENGNILSTLTSINKLYQLKRVNILQMNFNQNLAYMLEVTVKFRRPQNVNNCIG